MKTVNSASFRNRLSQPHRVMKRWLTLLSLILLVVLSLSLCFREDRAAAQGLRTTDWTLFDYRNDVDASDERYGGVGNVLPGVTYSLQNKSNPNIVKYGSREYGINLVWGTPNIRQEGDIRIEPQQGSGPIKQGQVVAIHVVKGGYLYYKSRKYGINLDFARTAQFEWELRPNPLEPRDAVPLKKSFGLYNRVVRDYVVYCNREHGINLAWARDCKQGFFRPS